MPYRKQAPVLTLPCPRCREDGGLLHEDRVAELSILACPRCQGVWLGTNVFREFRSDLDAWSEVLRQQPADQASHPTSYLWCPCCHQPMNRSNFPKGSGLVVDICSRHGVWFDAGELYHTVKHLSRSDPQQAREEKPSNEPMLSSGLSNDYQRREGSVAAAVADAVVGFLTGLGL